MDEEDPWIPQTFNDFWYKMGIPIFIKLIHKNWNSQFFRQIFDFFFL